MIVISTELGLILRFNNMKDLSAMADVLVGFRNKLVQSKIVSSHYDLIIQENKLSGMEKNKAVQRFTQSTGGIRIDNFYNENNDKKN